MKQIERELRNKLPQPFRAYEWQHVYGEGYHTLNTIAKVQPAAADFVLEHFNNTNRRFRSRQYQKLCRFLRNGRWVYNGEPMLFSDEPEVLNCQHRLFACRDTGIAIVTAITFGIPVKDKLVRSTQDTSTPRDNRDVLDAAGFENTSEMKVILNHLVQFEGVIKGTAKAKDSYALVDRPEVEDVVRSYPNLSDIIKYVLETVAAARKQRAEIPTPLTTLMFCAYHALMASSNMGSVKNFFNGVISGENVDGHRLQLRNWLLTGSPTKRRSGKHKAGVVISQELRIRYIFKAWNQWRNNVPCSSPLTVKDNEAFPIPK